MKIKLENEGFFIDLFVGDIATRANSDGGRESAGGVRGAKMLK